MNRVVFERSLCDGFRTTKVESVVSSLYGKRIFVGSNDGSLVAYECRQENSSIGRSYNCKILENIRKQSKDKKGIIGLINVESWRIFIGIIEGLVVTYDSQFFQLLNTIQDNKGCHLFAVNEKLFTIVVANKKKLSVYSWQQPNFSLRKEINIQDVPKVLYFVHNSVVVGYKKFYECIDLNTGVISRILDIEKDHKMIVVEIPKSSIRPNSLLLSSGVQGVVLNTESVLSGNSFAYGSMDEERIEWSALPLASQLMNPFLLSVLSDSTVEIHDLASLMPLQKISIASPAPHILSMAICVEDPTKLLIGSSSASSNSSSTATFAYHAYVCNGEQLSILKMIPLATQVDYLINSQQFEQAINLCKVCNNAELLVGINLIGLYESAANAMINKGDYEKAIGYFIMAKTDFVDVARNFPDLIPLPLHLSFNVYQTKKLTGSNLNRAALAAINLCEHYRPKIMKRAATAEKSRESGILGTGRSGGSYKNHMGAYDNSSYGDDEEEYIVDPEEELKRAQLLDTMYLFALMNCNPIRRPSVIDLLSSTNRCQIESCSVLLASHGNQYTEALLWLYRSQNQHTRVLSALTEDKCVAIGAWTTEQFYNWTADYLRWLWYNEDDASLPRQALNALKPVLEYDAELGLSVLVCRPPNKSTFGGKGVTITEVLNFLRSTTPKINYKRTNLSYGSSFAANNTSLSKLKDRGSLWQNEKGIAMVIATTPLINGHSLGVAFLECLISSGEAPSNMHDEFAQLLIEGLPGDADLPEAFDHNLNELEIKSEDSDTILLYKIYRKKLQYFLALSQDYHPLRILKFLPKNLLHELALIQSKLGKHKDVLIIYYGQLNNLSLAEKYCEHFYLWMNGLLNNRSDENASKGRLLNHYTIGLSQQQQQQQLNSPSFLLPSFNSTSNLKESGEIYLILFEVILQNIEAKDDTEAENSLNLVIRLAEKYFERFDVMSFLTLITNSIPSIGIGVLSNYFQIVFENLNTHKRTLMIMHQLLRKREVFLRNQQFDNDGSFSSQPNVPANVKK